MDQASKLYDYYMSIGDPRVEKWLLMDNPINTALILVGYFVLIFAIKTVMASRDPLELKSFIFVYNIFQVAVSFYIGYEIISVAVLSKYSLVCQPVDYSNDPLALRISSAMWLYFIIKMVDLIDTVIFALRKKQNQITFLHVFHHFSMVVNAWLGVKYVAGGQTFFLSALNSFVHVIMYTYYGLSAMGPAVQKYLWWKKYLTQLQLIQFFMIMIHSTVNLMTDCPYPKGFSLAFIIYGVMITLLFMNFYNKSYKSDSKGASSSSSKSVSSKGASSKKAN